MNWEKANLDKDKNLKTFELYPKKELDLIVANLNHPEVRKALLHDAKDATQKQKQIRTILKKFKDRAIEWDRDNNYYEISVQYFQKRFGRGRLFVKDSVGYLSMSKILRGTFCHGIYDDVDMTNAHPTILEQFIERVKLTKNKSLIKYNSNRVKVLEYIQSGLEISRDDAKKSLLILINGGELSKRTTKFTKRFYEDITKTIDEVYELCKKNRDYTKYLNRARENPKGKTINNMMTDVENTCLNSAVNKAIELGLNPTVLCFDGFMIQREYIEGEGFKDKVITGNDLKEISSRVYEDTGYNIKFVVKEFHTGIDTKKFTMDTKKIPTERDMTEIYYTHSSNKTKIFSEEDIFVFNKYTCLWARVSYKVLGNQLVGMLMEYFENEIKDAESLDAIRKILGRAVTSRNLGGLYSTQLEYRSPLEDMKLFNRKDWLVPFNKSCVDVRTLKVRDIRPEDYFTYSIPRTYKPQEKSEACEKIFSDFFRFDEEGFDEETYKSFKKIMGYAITGYTGCKCLFIMIGDTNSGKSTCINILSEVLSGMIKPVNTSIFVKGNQTHIDTDIVSLESGLRIGTHSELDENSSLDASKLKALTGSDRITIRPLRSDERTFVCKTKFFISTNSGKIPKFDVTDTGLQTRLILINFKNQFEEKPNFLSNWIKKYGDECFSWIVQQSYSFYKGGCTFERTLAMEAYKKKVFKDQNPMADFCRLFEPTEKIEEYTPNWKIPELYKSRTNEKLNDKQIQNLFERLRPDKMKCDRTIEGRRTKILYKYKLIVIKTEDKKEGGMLNLFE